MEKKIKIYIDPKNPYKYKNTYISNLSLFITLMSGLYMIVMVISCINKIKSDKEKKKFSQHLESQYHDLKDNT